MDDLQLIWKMDYGVDGEDSSLHTPLARAIRQLFDERKPFNRLNMCFFQGRDGILRWLGIFVKTAGNKIVFSPGFQDEYSDIQAYHGTAKQWEQPFQFDHLSLEKCKTKWHITTTRSTDHLGSPKTLDLGSSRVLWFGMSVSDENVLRVVNKNTLITTKSPFSDIQRRKNVFLSARENAQFPIVLLNTEDTKAIENGFIHFGVIVGSSGFDNYLNGELGFPYKSPYLEDPLPDVLTGIPTRMHRLKLSSDTDIQITSCILPGKLKTAASFTGQSESICKYS